MKISGVWITLCDQVLMSTLKTWSVQSSALIQRTAESEEILQPVTALALVAQQQMLPMCKSSQNQRLEITNVLLL